MTDRTVDYLFGKERSPFTGRVMARRARSACGPFMKEVASDRADRFCDFAFVHAEAPSGRFV
jgi:hypothetical protein